MKQKYSISIIAIIFAIIVVILLVYLRNPCDYDICFTNSNFVSGGFSRHSVPRAPNYRLDVELVGMEEDVVYSRGFCCSVDNQKVSYDDSAEYKETHCENLGRASNDPAEMRSLFLGVSCAAGEEIDFMVCCRLDEAKVMRFYDEIVEPRVSNEVCWEEELVC